MAQVLVDSSVWIRHFKVAELRLIRLLEADEVLTHEQIILELAVGSIPKRQSTIRDLLALKRVECIPFQEVLHFIDHNHLANSGLGCVNVQLIASCLAEGCELWTYDIKLQIAWKKVSPK